MFSEGDDSHSVPDGTHCPTCGADVGTETGSCQDCGMYSPSSEKLSDLLSTATKDRDVGTGFIRNNPIFLPIIVWRQGRIEGAQRELVEHKYTMHDSDTVYCRGCGDTLELDTTFCSECGTKTDLAVIDDVEFDVHDPTELEASVSNRWWLGVLGGPVVGFLAFAIAATLQLSIAPLLLVGGLVAAVIGWYFDRKYLRAKTVWDPPYWFYIPVLLLPVINLVGAVYYVWKRISMLGLEEHRSL